MTILQREWVPQTGMMPGLSIQQPFCQAILLRRKTIELRTWTTRYRGMLALHASKAWYGERDYGAYSWEALADIIRRLDLPHSPQAYPLGAIVGVARLVQCGTLNAPAYERLRDFHRSDAPWSPRTVGWFFEEVHALAIPLPFLGHLGLFAVPQAEVGR